VKYRILIEQNEEGTYIAEVSSLPGCISQGKTTEEALANIKDAIRGYLQNLRKYSKTITSSIPEEILNAAFLVHYSLLRAKKLSPKFL
jgi:predicted RNase H-like HicB family nuclease